MRLLHLADLHLGKCVLEAPMLDDQRSILKSAVKIAEERGVDAVLIAGDVYDRSIPPAEAVCVLDDFLNALSERGIAVFAVSGNHDSPERLEFGSRLFADHKIHIAGFYNGTLRSVTMDDRYGKVNFYLLPFIKPAMVRATLGEEVSNTEDAVRAALKCFKESAACCPDDRNVLIAHQFVCFGSQTPETCDSELPSIGGSDSVDASCFDGFDYVALGHLHRAQRIGRDTIRYAGSPLKYSLSEVLHKKSFTLVELSEKGKADIELIPVDTPHDLRRIKGRLEDLLAAGRSNPADINDYIDAVLTDEEVLDPAAKLRMVYPNLLHIEIDRPGNEAGEDIAFDPMAGKSETELFEDFFRHVHGTGLSAEQRAVLNRVMACVKKEDADNEAD